MKDLATFTKTPWVKEFFGVEPDRLYNTLLKLKSFSDRESVLLEDIVRYCANPEKTLAEAVKFV